MESNPEESMSTSKQDDKPSGNWWDTWLSSAKTKVSIRAGSHL